MASRTTTAVGGSRVSPCLVQTGSTVNISKTLHVQDQIIEQLRGDQAALREALETERNALRECRLNNDKELKVLQRENLQLQKLTNQQQLRLDEVERELAEAKELLSSEQKSLKALEKEHIVTVKELKLRNTKEYDKSNRQEMLIDQLKSEVEDLKESLDRERNATGILIREHNTEVKRLREEVKQKSTEAYRELKDR